MRITYENYKALSTIEQNNLKLTDKQKNRFTIKEFVENHKHMTFNPMVEEKVGLMTITGEFVFGYATRAKYVRGRVKGTIWTTFVNKKGFDDWLVLKFDLSQENFYYKFTTVGA